MNWFVIILVGVVLMALIIFLILSNRKDQEKLENTLNQVEKKPGHRNEEDPDDVKNT